MGQWRYIPTILDVGTRCERWASRPVRFTPGIHWIGGWVDPRGLEVVEKKYVVPARIQTPAVSPSLYRLLLKSNRSALQHEWRLKPAKSRLDYMSYYSVSLTGPLRTQYPRTARLGQGPQIEVRFVRAEVIRYERCFQQFGMSQPSVFITARCNATLLLWAVVN
jgi:hypothetical protein